MVSLILKIDSTYLWILINPLLDELEEDELEEEVDDVLPDELEDELIGVQWLLWHVWPLVHWLLLQQSPAMQTLLQSTVFGPQVISVFEGVPDDEELLDDDTFTNLPFG